MPEPGPLALPAKSTLGARLGRPQRDALRLLGYFLLRQARGADAADVFRALVAIDPQDRQAYRALIAARLDEGRTEEALALAEDYHPEKEEVLGATVHLLRAQALWRLGRGEEARQAFDAFLRMRAVS